MFVTTLLAAATSGAVPANDRILHSFTAQPTGPQDGVIQDASGFLYGVSDGGGQGMVFRYDPRSGQIESLHSFAGGATDGGYPNGSLILDSNGILYGVTQNGGAHEDGALYRLDSKTGAFSLLHSFAGGLEDGHQCDAGPALDSNGILYGLTVGGGPSNLGTIYSYDTRSGSYSLIHIFAGGTNDGATPFGGVAVGANGIVFGMTQVGGAHGKGVIFSYNPGTGSYRVVHNFAGGNADGEYPDRSPVLDGSGILYGVTRTGGMSGDGTLFKFDTNTSSFAVLHSFSGGHDGSAPRTSILIDSSGLLRGVAEEGGDQGDGVVFHYSLKSGGFSVDHAFTSGSADGAGPFGPLIQSPTHLLIGTAYAGGLENLGILYTVDTTDSKFQILHSFSTLASDGANPAGAVVAGPDGQMYGTTQFGGKQGAGTLFRYDPSSATTTVLHSFGSGSSDGIYPMSNLVLASGDILYGLASAGGTAGRGALFEYDTKISAYGVVHSFSGGTEDGSYPVGSLALDASGTLYGTTDTGGTNDTGTIFKLQTGASTFSTIFSFPTNADNEWSPQGALPVGEGILYGTSSEGGTERLGTIFKVTLASRQFTILHSFSGGPNDGAYPYSPLVAVSGALYGTTFQGGGSDEGTLFRFDLSSASFSVAHSFSGDASDGTSPEAVPVADASGTLYGTTVAGGSAGRGTIYSYSTETHAFQILHAFLGSSLDGAGPVAPVTLGTAGEIFGTAETDGVFGGGVLFQWPGTAGRIDTAPIIGPPGTTVFGRN